jgi:hypothetical protein
MVSDGGTEAYRPGCMFGAGEARDLLARADLSRHALSGESGFYPAHRAHQVMAIAAAVTCLVLHGDPADVALVESGLVALEDHSMGFEHVVGEAQEAIEHFVRRPAVGPAELDRLARSRSAHVRRSLCLGLAKRERSEVVARLETLARDPYSIVRIAAREVLPAGHLPPWYGVFSRDPFPEVVAHLRAVSGAASSTKLEGEARALADEVCAAFLKPWWELEPVERDVVARCQSLPDALLLDLAANVASLEIHHRPHFVALEAATREGGPRLLVELVTRWVELMGRASHLAATVARAVDLFGMPDAEKRRLGRRLLEVIRGADLDADVLRVVEDLALDLVKGAPSDEIAPCLVAEGALLVAPSYPLYRLVDSWESAPRELLEWARHAALEGGAFASTDIWSLVKNVLSKGPVAEERAVALRFVGDDDPSPVPAWAHDAEVGATSHPGRTWALGMLLDRGFEPGPHTIPAQRAIELFRVPKNREAFLRTSALVAYVLPEARAALVRGELSFPEAHLVATSAVDLSGTSKVPCLYRSTLDDAERAVFDPRAFEPLDEATFAAYLELRRAHVFAGPGLEQVDFDVVGPDSAEGRELAMALARGVVSGERVAFEQVRRELLIRPTPVLVEALREVGAVDDRLGVDGDFVVDEVTRAEASLSGAKGAWKSRFDHRRRKLVPGTKLFPDLALVPLDRARAWLARAVDAIDSNEPPLHEIGYGVSRHCRFTLQFAAAACVLHGDTTAAIPIADAIRDELVPEAVDLTILAERVGELVALMPASTKRVRILAKDDSVYVRLAVAGALRARDPGAHELLVALAQDVNIEVSNTAKAAIGEGALPWWLGVFRRDPAESLSDEEAESLTPVFEEIRAAVALGRERLRDRRASAAALGKLSAALPVHLAAELARSRGREIDLRDGPAPCLVAALRREGAGELLLELLSGWRGDPNFVLWFDPNLIAPLRKAERAKFVAGALRFAADLGSPEGRDLARVVALALGRTDAAAAADTLVALASEDEEGFFVVAGAFEGLLKKARAAPLEPWALRHVLRDADASHLDVDRLAEAVLARAPREAVRPAALAALAVPTRRAWAVAQLVGRCHVAELDGSRASRVAALYADPDFRHCFFTASLLKLALRHARRDLVDGRLELPEALMVVRCVMASSSPNADGDDEKPAKRPVAPLSEREREAYIAARRGYVFKGKGWRLLDLDVVGAGSELGLATLEAAVEAAAQGDDKAANAVAAALFGHSDADVARAALRIAKGYGDAGLPSLLHMALSFALPALGMDEEMKALRERRDRD